MVNIVLVDSWLSNHIVPCTLCFTCSHLVNGLLPSAWAYMPKTSSCLSNTVQDTYADFFLLCAKGVPTVLETFQGCFREARQHV